MAAENYSAYVSVTGLDEVEDMLKGFENADKVFDRFTNRVLDIIKRQEQIEAPFKSGRLQRTIFTYKGGYYDGFISTDRRIEYPLYVHEGHKTRGGGSFVKANPFAQRAIDNSTQMIDNEINNLFETLTK